MRFNYFVVAAVTAVYVHALTIHNFTNVVPGTGLDKDASVTAAPEFCSKDLTSKPTATQLKQCMKTAATVANKAFFWSRAGSKVDYLAEAKKWRAAYNPGLLVLDDFWLDSKVHSWAYAQAAKFGDQQTDMFWIPASQAMAELANGKVTVILPAGVNPVVKPVKDPIVWYDVEYPALKKNGAVNGIFKVSPGSPKEERVPGSFALEGAYQWYEAMPVTPKGGLPACTTI